VVESGKKVGLLLKDGVYGFFEGLVDAGGALGEFGYDAAQSSDFTQYVVDHSELGDQLYELTQHLDGVPADERSLLVMGFLAETASDRYDLDGGAFPTTEEGWLKLTMDAELVLSFAIPASRTASAAGEGAGRAATETSAGVDGLRFGDSDLVYGPSAGRQLADLADEAGGRTLTHPSFGSPDGLSWPEFSAQAMETQLSKGGQIRFDLTNMADIRGVLAGTGPWANTVTATELRYLQSNWSRFQNNVTFYVNRQPVPPPW